MRFLWALIPLSLCSFASAAASEPAHVYLYDPGSNPSNDRPQTVDAATARLIFSSRLGLSEFESLENAKQNVIDQLNSLGGNQVRLFGQDEQRTQERGFIVVHGVHNPNDFIQKSLQSYTRFLISKPPSSVTWLMQDYIDMADIICKRPNSPWRYTYNAEDIAGVFDSDEDSVTRTRGPVTFVIRSELARLESDHGINSAQYQAAYIKLQEAFDSLIELAKHENFSLTVLFMPPLAAKASKRSEDAWGSLNVPRAAEVLGQEPELLQNQTLSSSSSAARPLAQESPLRGPIPSCFSSLSECQSGTRNCTSHGTCVLKYRTDDGVCYGCACTIPEIRTNPDGSKKTTRFGGAACNKKDVVMPFWLFAGFGVMMAGLISYGIGMLYSMGNEELPSVIGAGVSGPKAK